MRSNRLEKARAIRPPFNSYIGTRKTKPIIKNKAVIASEMALVIWSMKKLINVPGTICRYFKNTMKRIMPENIVRSE